MKIKFKKSVFFFTFLLVIILIILLTVVTQYNIGKKENSPYIPFRSYFEYVDNVEVKETQFEATDCRILVRDSLLKQKLPSIIRWHERDPAEIDFLIREMNRCDSTYFSTEPIYHMLKYHSLIAENGVEAFEHGIRSLNLFEEHADTSGMVAILVHVTLLTGYTTVQNIDELNDKLLFLSKSSSSKKDNLIYYHTLFRNAINGSYPEKFDKDKSFEEVKKIYQSDPSQIDEYSAILSTLGTLEVKDGNNNRAMELVKENYFLENIRKNYISIINYSYRFSETFERDSIYKYYQLAFNNYLESPIKVLGFERYYYEKMSDHYKSIKDHNNAWKYRDFSDSINNLINTNIKTKEIIEIQTKQELNLEKINNSQLKVEQKFLYGTISSLLLFLVVLIFLIRNLIINKQKAKSVLEFKESAFRMISHDMLSPLQALNAYLTTLKSDYQIDSKLNLSKPLDNVIGSIIRLQCLAHDTIEYLWLNDKEKEPKSLTFVFSNSIILLEMHLNSLGIEIILEPTRNVFDDDIKHPYCVAAILRNIITNIAKHNAPSRIMINSTRTEDYIIITIQDNVTPLSKEKINQILSAISMKNSSTSRLKETKTGMGLNIIKRKLNSTNSKLEIISNEKGNCYRLLVPAV